MSRFVERCRVCVRELAPDDGTCYRFMAPYNTLLRNAIEKCHSIELSIEDTYQLVCPNCANGVLKFFKLQYSHVVKTNEEFKKKKFTQETCEEFICGYDACDKMFKHKLAFFEHLEDEHIKNKGLTEKGRTEVKRRYPTATDEINEGVICDDCGESFQRKLGYFDHWRDHHAKSESRKDRKQLNLERKRLEERDCELEDEFLAVKFPKFFEEIGIKPYEEPISDKKWNCFLCNKLFEHEDRLESHHKTHKKWTCETCETVFPSNQKLLRHILTHTGVQPFKCPKCNKRFRTEEHKILHKAQHPISKKGFQCGECKKWFLKRPQLRKHENTCKKHICGICKQGFRLKKKLIAHMKEAHPEQKLYQCEACQSVFLTEKELTAHRQSHINLFKCTICQKSYKTKGILATHINTHTLSKTFHCDVCKKQFSTKGNMLTHRKRIHGRSHLATVSKVLPTRTAKYFQKQKQKLPQVVSPASLK